MKERSKDIASIIIVGFLCLLLGGFIGAGAFPTEKTVVTEKVVEVTVPTYDEVTQQKINEIYIDLRNDDNWEKTAEDLATAEWSKRDYKEIYKAIDDLIGNIDEKEDIEKVVVKDTEFSSMDDEDKDAIVTQELKVYYEDLDGDDKKAYLTAETIIEDGEVEDIEIALS